MAKVQPGAALSDLRGSLSGLILSRTRNGYALRQRPRYKPTFTPSQKAAQQRFQAAMAAWNSLSFEQAAAWNNYARTLLHHNEVDGTTYAPSGQNIFASLASKFLQINPEGEVPLTPPAFPFNPELLLLDRTAGPGTLTFTASGPNTGTTQTELLLQRLKNQRRSPTDKYVSQGFVAFTEENLQHTLTLEPGWVVPAYRFVNAATGEMTELLTLGILEIPAP